MDATGTESRLSEAVDRFLTPRSWPTTQRDADMIAEGRGLSLACGLAATEWGDGPPVLLAHGWESRRTHWSGFIPAIVGAGFRAVGIDAPAHGDSPGARTTVLEYGRKLVEVGRELGPLAGIVGHSFGAAAIPLALERGLDAGRAVLIGGPSSLGTLMTRWALKHGIAEADVEAFIALVARQAGAPVDAFDLTRVASELQTPALIIHDRNDESVELSDALALAAAWPGARTLITARHGHRRILIAKEVLQTSIRFLKGEN